MIISKEESLRKSLKDHVFSLPSDTIYSLSCLASSKIGQERIREIKKRESKPFIILISSYDQLENFVSSYDKEFLSKYWPGMVTFIFEDKAGGTVALRMVKDEYIKKFIDIHGPIVSTSLNISGESAILSSEDAKEFEDKLDFMVFGGSNSTKPSTLYNTITKTLIRQGDIIIKD